MDISAPTVVFAMRRAGGSVVIDTAGGITLTPAAGQDVTLASGQLLLPNGSAAAPSLSFAAADTWGFYRTSDGIASAVVGIESVLFTTSGFACPSGNSLSWLAGAFGAAIDLSVFRDAANVMAQRNGANAQALRVYNTFTDASNYERLKVAWESNVLNLLVQAGGTGASRSMVIGTDNTSSGSLSLQTLGVNRWTVGGSTGHLVAGADATYDIGASGATRPRDLFLSRNVVVGGALDHDGTTAGFYGATPATQPTAVADAAGGVVIDAEARTALNALLARLRTLGLIAI